VSPRLGTILVGLASLALGLAALAYPGRAMGLLGYAWLDASNSAAVLGEVRATYGGIFIVLGAYTLASAAAPWNHRSRLLLLSLVWLGAFAARLFGVWIDGNPGIFGWASAVFEAAMGGTLLFASQASAPPVSAPAPLPAQTQTQTA
jgi:hypothetical protein